MRIPWLQSLAGAVTPRQVMVEPETELAISLASAAEAPRPRRRREAPVLMSRSAAALVLGIDRGRLAKYIAQGVVRGTPKGKRVAIDRDEVERLRRVGLPALTRDGRGILVPSKPRRRRRAAAGGGAGQRPGAAIRALKLV